MTLDIENQLGQFIAMHREHIRQQILEPEETLAIFRTFRSDAQHGDEIGIPVESIDEVVQPYQLDYTPKGSPSFTANKVTQRMGKIDMKIEPMKLIGFWEAHLYSMVNEQVQMGNTLYNESQARKDMPFVNYVINRALNKGKEDRELKYIYGGVYSAPTPGTPGLAAETVDGIEKITDDAVTAGQITPFALGAYTATDIFDYMEAFFDLIPEQFRKMPLNIMMSYTNYVAYGRDKRATFNWQQSIADLLKIDFSMMNIKPYRSMSGKDRMIATIPGNFFRYIHKIESMDKFELQTFDRYIKLLMEWHECFTIADRRYVWINDQV